MMRLHSLRAARASFNSFADPFVIDTAADANDHENDLQLHSAIVKNDSQLGVDFIAARNGWRSASWIGKVAA